jgi:hypothetical protein
MTRHRPAPASRARTLRPTASSPAARVAVWFASCAALILGAGASAAPPKATLVDVKKIADDAPHSAFTDLIYRGDEFICAFRQGRRHVSSDGRISVRTSSDGEQWETAATLSLPGYDLRDASLSTTPDGRLMLLGGASPRKKDNEKAPTGSFVAFSDDAREWTTPEIIVEPGRWLWRVTWQDGKGYGIGYSAGGPDLTADVMMTEDGRKYEHIAEKIAVPGRPTEAVIRFADDGTAICLQRRDGAPDDRSAYLGVAKPPYRDWQWRDLGFYFGGPNLLRTPSGHWIAAGRIFAEGDEPKTVVAALDVDGGSLEPILTLPSGGDTSYPGLVWKDDQLWVSYYSSHEGKSNIYLAKVKIE